MSDFIYEEKYVYIWVAMVPTWNDWRKKENSLKFNLSKIKTDIKNHKPFKSLFLNLSILCFYSSFRINYVSCSQPLISMDIIWLCFEWKETRRYYCGVCDKRLKVTITVLGNQDFKASKQN